MAAGLASLATLASGGGISGGITPGAAASLLPGLTGSGGAYQFDPAYVAQRTSAVSATEFAQLAALGLNPSTGYTTPYVGLNGPGVATPGQTQTAGVPYGGQTYAGAVAAAQAAGVTVNFYGPVNGTNEVVTAVRTAGLAVS